MNLTHLIASAPWIAATSLAHALEVKPSSAVAVAEAQQACKPVAWMVLLGQKERARSVGDTTADGLRAVLQRVFRAGPLMAAALSLPLLGLSVAAAG